MGRMLIEAGWVVTPAEVLTDAAVACEGNRITYVGPRSSAPDPGPEGDRIRHEDGVLIPGLINTHTHAAMSFFRAAADDLPLQSWLTERIWPVEERLTAADIAAGTRLALLEMIQSGTTTFADMYFFMDEVARSTAEAGLRAVLARGLIGAAPNGQEALADSRRFFRDWHGAADGRIRVYLGPHAPYTCPPDYLRQVADTAGELGTGIHIHLAETAREVEELQQATGRTPVELLFDTGLSEHPLILAHLVHPTAGDLSLLGRLRGGVAHCPLSNLKLAAGVAPVTGIRATGMPVGLGTDGVGSGGSLDLFEAMRLAALLPKGLEGDATALPAAVALSMASLEGARVLGLAEETGSIEVGKKADLVVVGLSRAGLLPVHDPRSLLVYGGTGQDVRQVFVDGRLLYDRGSFLTLDAEAILAEAVERTRRLFH